ncbi:hypothetical protein F2Q68_00045054 [Brassica cretica]|uniref:Uncharacterized protein n=1 Tax=Brassica cretica TaxID=69181 RepID=A0A8S9LIN7_BRACR|nr:hypothetical protein F2Q68_00045054 [Brassica cretica]
MTAKAMKAERSPWEGYLALEVCEAVLVSGAAPVNFRRNSWDGEGERGDTVILRC